MDEFLNNLEYKQIYFILDFDIIQLDYLILQDFNYFKYPKEMFKILKSIITYLETKINVDFDLNF